MDHSLRENLGKIAIAIRVFRPKTKIPIQGSKSSSSSKTICSRGIKVLNLEAPGHAVLAPKF